MEGIISRAMQRINILPRWKAAAILKSRGRCARSGFTIVEVTIAAFVIIVGIAGTFSLLTQTYSYTTSSSMNLTAAYLAEEAIEMIGNIRDSNILEMYYGDLENWANKIDACSSGCEIDYAYFGAPTPYGEGRYLLWNGQFFNYSSGEPSIFKRKITAQLGGPGNRELIAHVEILWNERGRQHNFSVQEKIYGWLVF